ncbi:Phosphoglycolate phosphatase [Orchesella cincta]|uniref:Phosphoglycolate phosphatase n=1 Tax=Orchesella cincta TaxID=48709 RepID=A0A1D2N9S4_ORCCI|nr:Phosphoglycolate phosphatase [Orchesella cincta]
MILRSGAALIGRYLKDCRKVFSSPSYSISSNFASMESKHVQNGNALSLASLPKEQLTSFMQDIDAVMFDCDGVLWLGMDPLENAQALVIKLRSMGKKVFFMTNNSTRTQEEFLEKFNKLGFEASVDEIVGTAFLAALYLKECGFKDKVYVIGSEGITKELAKVGIDSLPIGPDAVDPTSLRWNPQDYNIDLDPSVGAVIVGFDHHISYTKILKAASYLNNDKCLFVATNTDEQFPARGLSSIVCPGTGTFVNAVKTAAGREPVVMGKPEPFPFEYVQRKHNLQPNRVLMVGDRGNTDILFGRECGLWTLLVMSGVTDINSMRRWETSQDPAEKMCVPDYYSQDVNEFYKLLQN